MSTLIILLVAVIVTLILCLAIVGIEATAGRIGDNSLVPGFLAIGGFTCGLIVVAGFVTGNWGFWYH